MDKKTFNNFRDIVYKKSGISLNDSKVALVTARVSKRMRALKIADFKQYLDLVLKDESGEEVVHLLDVISTNVTQFFRERNHFDFLSVAFKNWVAAGSRRFRIWSAACSTGEEPYSIAMTLMSTPELPTADMKILATDISTRVLAKCLEGRYEESRMEDVPKQYRTNFFTKHVEEEETIYTVKSHLKSMIIFRRLNLSEIPFPMRGPLDVVFCRNVMIYFDNEIRKRLLAEIHRLLKPGGYLMVGHAESLTSIVSDFKPVKPSIYIKA